MEKFVLLVEFDVDPASLGSFVSLIETNAQDSVGKEPGCFQFDVMQTLDDPNKVVLYEVYASEQAFQMHMGMTHTQTFLAAAKPLVRGQRVLRMARKVAPPIKAG